MQMLKRALWDISGAFGDIGVLFPISLALIARNGFNPTALFLMAGAFYALTSWYFRITMPVQPLKAMATIAIASGLGSAVINAAGIIMGAILLLLSFSGLSEKLGSLFPVPIVRGIQLGLGLILLKTAVPMMASDALVATATVALLAVCLLLIRGVPPLIPVLVLGIAVAIGRVETLVIGPVPLSPALPSLSDLGTGLILLVMPQLALTFGNAIVATEATGALLYGQRARRLTLKSIPLSMGIANLLSGILGGAPMCHGCGGLTAHRKFGAETGRSGLIIGGFLIVLALGFGSSSLSLISAFPRGILGVLLFYVGVQHSLFIRDVTGDARAMTIAVTVAVTGFATGNLSIGFLSGFSVYYALQAFEKNTSVKGGLDV